MTTAKKPSVSITDQLAFERRLVDFDSYDISVQQLIAMVTKNQIDVAPAYQRRFRWLGDRQSQLIESIFLGIPVPNLFMATNSDGTWEVVDGVQRLSTIVRFAGDASTREKLGLKEPLRISNLEKLGAMNGLVYEDIPQAVQVQFMLRPIKVTTLSDKSDMKVRFDLFERLNTGGLRLTDQEIRGCIFRGQFNDFLERMATNENFKKVVVLRDSMERDGTREEYVLRFFAFLNNYKNFDHSVVGFLNAFMADASKTFNYSQNEKTFIKVFDHLAKAFPTGLSRRTRLTPVNLFEAISVGAAQALNKRTSLSTRTIPKWIASDEFKKLVTGATNTKTMVAGRIEYAARKFGAP